MADCPMLPLPAPAATGCHHIPCIATLCHRLRSTPYQPLHFPPPCNFALLAAPPPAQVYYGTPASHEIKGVWCHPCYQEIKTETVPLEGFNIKKAELEKRKNDDEVGGRLVSWVIALGWR